LTCFQFIADGQLKKIKKPHEKVHRIAMDIIKGYKNRNRSIFSGKREKGE